MPQSYVDQLLQQENPLGSLLFSGPKIEKLISSPIDQCNLKRLFSVLLHRHDMSDRNLGFR